MIAWLTLIPALLAIGLNAWLILRDVFWMPPILFVRLKDAWHMLRCGASFTRPDSQGCRYRPAAGRRESYHADKRVRLWQFECGRSEEHCLRCPRRDLYRQVANSALGREVEQTDLRDSHLKGTVIDDLDLQQARIAGIQLRPNLEAYYFGAVGVENTEPKGNAG